MKKLLCMLLAVLCLLSLCACGGAPAANNTTPAAEAEPAAEEANPSGATANDAGVYRVLVQDAEGAAIPDVTVQFCDDTACTQGTTDQDGIATFEAEEGDYSVHILATPAGVVGTDEEFFLLRTYSDVTVTLEREAFTPYEPLETNFGFRFEYPEEYQHLKGELGWWITSFGNNFATADLYYAQVPEEEREAFREEAAQAALLMDGWSPEWMRGQKYKNTPLFSVLAIMDDEESVEYYETITPQEYMLSFYDEATPADSRVSVPVYVETVPFENDWTLVVQRNQLYTFGGEAQPITDSVGYLDEGYREEALMLLEKPEIFISGLKEAEWDQPGEIGDKVSFETTTLQGDAITSDELFSGHKVTMINLWATWCGPCVRELPELEKLNAKFAEQDCQIIGVCLDARDDETKEEALQILEQAGVTYPNLNRSYEMDWANISVYPTTFFVSEDGTILTEPVVGADISGYSRVLKEALSQVG